MNIGWIDFSKEDRNKAMSVMSLLKEKGAVDEIGIGIVRDAFANEFFPGTSTIQNGAKYFFIVPYVIKETVNDVINGKIGSDLNKILQIIDDKEKECGKLLLKSNDSEKGVIGKLVLEQGKWLVRPPSSIYWNGIRAYGIFKQAITIPDLIKIAINLQGKRRMAELGDKGEIMKNRKGDDLNASNDEGIQLFSVPDDYFTNWRENLTVALTKSEAEFLRKRIKISACGTLLEYALRNNIDLYKYDTFECLYEALKNSDLSDEIKEKMKLACDFNKLVYAIHVRYNYILSNGKNKKAELKWQEIIDDIDSITSVDVCTILKKLIINNYKLKCFLLDFQKSLKHRNFEEADKIIINREIYLKSFSRAKLCKRDDYNDDTWIGGEYLDYRLPYAARILKDIYEGERDNV